MKTVLASMILIAAVLAQPAYAAKRGPYPYRINETREEKSRRLSNANVTENSPIERRWQRALSKTYRAGDIELTRWNNVHVNWSHHKRMICDEHNQARCILMAVQVNKDANFELWIDESLYDKGAPHKTKTLSRTICDLDAQECWDFEKPKDKRPVNIGGGGYIRGIDIWK